MTAPTCDARYCDEPAPRYHAVGYRLCTRHALIAEALRLAATDNERAS